MISTIIASLMSNELNVLFPLGYSSHHNKIRLPQISQIIKQFKEPTGTVSIWYFYYFDMYNTLIK